MENFFVVWSTPIAVFSLFFLSSLSTFVQAPKALRVIGSLILLPSILSATFLLRLTKESFIYVGRTWSLIPLDMHGVISYEFALLMVLFSIALIALLFILPSHRLVETIKALSLCFFMLCLLAFPINCFVAFALFSLGSFVISYNAIKESERNSLDDDIGEIFLWQRLSDLLLFISLLLIAIEQSSLSFLLLPKIASKISPLVIVLFFLGLVLRLTPLSGRRALGNFSDFRAILLEEYYVSLGISFLLLRMRDIIFLSQEANYFLISCTALILFRALFAPLTARIFFFKTINTFLVCLLIIFVCYQQYVAAQFAFVILAMLAPLALLIADHREAWIRTSANSAYYLDPLHRFMQLSKGMVAFAAESSTNFTGPVYGNFFMYRIPQLIVTIFELPLRLFHNGSIQRSLLFIIVSLATYYWWWER